MGKKWKPNPKRLREQGSFRVNKIALSLYPKYPTSTFTIVPKYEFGTGPDLIIYNNQTRRIVELHEILNWKKYLRDGRVLRVLSPRFNSIVRNLTTPVHKVYGMYGQIRVYTQPNTLKFLHVSYKESLSPSQLRRLKFYGITLKAYERTELLNGYFKEYKMKDGNILRMYYDDNGIYLRSKIIKVVK